MSDHDVATGLQTLAVLQVAPSLGANAAELLDSRAFRTVLDSLDLGASDYGQRVSAAVSAAVQGDPARFKTPADPLPETPAGPALGEEAGPAQWGEDDVQRATPAQVDAAMRAGQLTALGIPAPRARR